MVVHNLPTTGSSNDGSRAVAPTTDPGDVPADPTPPVGDYYQRFAQSGPIVAAVRVFRAAFVPARRPLEILCRTFVPGDPKRKGATARQRRAAVPMLCALLRRRPELARVDPDAIDALCANGVALRELATEIRSFLAAVEDGSRAEFRDAWILADAIKSAAEQQAKTSPQMATELAEVRAIFAKGSRIESGVVVTAIAAHAAAKAHARMTVAQQRAAAASQHATRVVQAHIAQNPAAPVSAPPIGDVDSQQTDGGR